LPLQRQLTLMAEVGAMVDGRDIGTVVFPDADLKIFMTASLKERAKRRLNQIGVQAGAEAGGAPITLEDIMRDIESRDLQDSARGEAPLKKADDAVEFDTSGMNLNEAVQSLTDLVRSKVAR